MRTFWQLTFLDSTSGTVYGFKYWKDPGAFSNGVLGVINALVLAALSMTGTDIVGVSAGESANPRKAIPQAVKNVFFRIIFIYILSVFVMGMVIPWNDPHNLTLSGRDSSVSPFTLVFQKAGLKGADSVVNAVILITVSFQTEKDAHKVYTDLHIVHLVW